MALFKCTDCGHDVNVEAKTCPNCGATKPFKNQKLTQDQVKELSFSERLNFQKLGGTIEIGKMTKIAWAGVGILLLFVIFGPEKEKTPEEIAAAEAEKKEQEESWKRSMLQSSCQTEIERSLNDPDSADWGEFAVIPLKDGTYSVIQDLRAKNAFGAMVKGSFECVSTYDGTNAVVLSATQIGQ